MRKNRHVNIFIAAEMQKEHKQKSACVPFVNYSNYTPWSTMKKFFEFLAEYYLTNVPIDDIIYIDEFCFHRKPIG